MGLTSGREGSLIVWGYRRMLAAAAVTVATAGAMWLSIFAWPLYLLPLMPAMRLRCPLGIAFAVEYLALPLAGIVWWGRPWWARSACLGTLLANLAFVIWVPGAFARSLLRGRPVHETRLQGLDPVRRLCARRCSSPNGTWF
jgi:hypothetical protein